MKVTVNVECTPDEARTFMGLPDVQPMQEAFMRELQDRLTSSMRGMVPESLLQNWLPAGMSNAEQFQKMFWDQIQNTMTGVVNATTSGMVSLQDRRKG